MPLLFRLPLALALTVAIAATLSACGGEDAKLLPGETAREIVANLDTVQQLAAEGDCVGAEAAALQIGEQIEAVEGVDPKLKQALEEGAVRLEEVIAECEEAEVEAVEPAEVPEEGEEDEPKEEKEKKEKEPKPDKEAEAEEPEGSPQQSNGNGKGLEEGGGPPPSEEESGGEPSGGVSPGAAVGEAE